MPHLRCNQARISVCPHNGSEQWKGDVSLEHRAASSQRINALYATPALRRRARHTLVSLHNGSEQWNTVRRRTGATTSSLVR